jgi:hypothetical protein
MLRTSENPLASVKSGGSTCQMQDWLSVRIVSEGIDKPAIAGGVLAEHNETSIGVMEG